MSMWSLRWHFTNKSVTGAPYCKVTVIRLKGYSYSLSHSWTLWWRVRWLKQYRLEVAAAGSELHMGHWKTGSIDLADQGQRGCIQSNNWPPARTHAHTHTRLTALFLGLHRWAGIRKVKPIWILLKQETLSGSGISWAICKSNATR